MRDKFVVIRQLERLYISEFSALNIIVLFVTPK